MTLTDLFSYFYLILSHGGKAAETPSSQPQEERKGTSDRDTTSEEETKSTSTSKCRICGKAGHRAGTCWLKNQKHVNNIQQQQLPPHQQFQLQKHQVSQFFTCLQKASSCLISTTHRNNYSIVNHIINHNFYNISFLHYQVVTPGPTIYDITAIDAENACEGGQPPDFGNSCHFFNINQLNRKYLRDPPRGLLGLLCDNGVVTSVAPRHFADHAPLQLHYTQLALSTTTNQPIHFYGYKDILFVCNNNSFPMRLLHL